MGTPKFAVMPLREIAKKHNVKLVVTQEDKKKGRGKKLLPSEVKIASEELDIEVYQPKNINSEESIDKLKSIGADIFIVVAFGQILREEVLNMTKYGAINIHASLLPKLRGAAPINRAIIDGEEKTGISIMKMNKGLDTGDVALQKEIIVGDLDSEELSNRLSEIGSELILEFLDKIENDKINYTVQEESESTYAEKITKDTQEILFNSMSTDEILRLIRGMIDRGGAFSLYKGDKIKIYKAIKTTSDSSNSPGTVLEKLKIKTLDGAIEIKELQLPGKKRMDAKSFLLGNTLEEGIILGG